MIELKLKDYTCSDGCCYETYYYVYLNNKLIGSTDCESADSVVDFINENLHPSAISVLFAEFIISDYEMVNDGDNLLWELCGTKQRYTSEELCKVFINEHFNIKEDGMES